MTLCQHAPAPVSSVARSSSQCSIKLNSPGAARKSTHHNDETWVQGAVCKNMHSR